MYRISAKKFISTSEWHAEHPIAFWKYTTSRYSFKLLVLDRAYKASRCFIHTMDGQNKTKLHVFKNFFKTYLKRIKAIWKTPFGKAHTVKLILTKEKGRPYNEFFRSLFVCRLPSAHPSAHKKLLLTLSLSDVWHPTWCQYSGVNPIRCLHFRAKHFRAKHFRAKALGQNTLEQIYKHVLKLSIDYSCHP